jgi:hypothetical protein
MTESQLFGCLDYEEGKQAMAHYSVYLEIGADRRWLRRWSK